MIESSFDLKLDDDDIQSQISVFDPTEIDQTRAELLLMLWRARSHKAARAHYKESQHQRRSSILGTTTNAGLSIGVLFFANAEWIGDVLPFLIGWLEAALKESGLTSYGIITSLLAVILVFTTILQYLRRWSDKAAEHKFAGSEFANLQRKIERYSLCKTYNMSMIHNINREYNHISKSYPLTASKRWDDAGKKYRLEEQITELEDRLIKIE